MALQNKTTNEYHRIEGIDKTNNLVLMEEYFNLEHRQTGDTKWLIKKEHKVSLPNLCETINSALPLAELNILNNEKTIAYLELKKLEDYKNLIDC